MEDLDQEFSSNIKYDLEKNANFNNNEKISIIKAKGTLEKENTSKTKIENESKSIKKVESSCKYLIILKFRSVL